MCNTWLRVWINNEKKDVSPRENGKEIMKFLQSDIWIDQKGIIEITVDA